MSDYISRYEIFSVWRSMPKPASISSLTDAINRTPAADVEPVVRCRECRYYAASGATTSFCIHPGGMKFTSDSDYCSRGKRRDQSADVRNMGQFAGGGKTGGPNDADQH